MKSTYQVKVTYKRAISDTNELEHLAQRVETKRKKIESERIQLGDFWKGNNSNKYKQKMYEREKELLDMVNYLRSIANTVRTVAQNSYNADMRSIQIAQQKSKKKK